MNFHKIPFRSNFQFLRQGHIRERAAGLEGEYIAADFQPSSTPAMGPQRITLTCRRYAEDIYSIHAQSPSWKTRLAQSDLSFPEPAEEGETRLTIDEDAQISWRDSTGRILLESYPGSGFGISGLASMFLFRRHEADRFYGMGEKMFPLERSGTRTKFWNTDVVGDFPACEVEQGRPDPMYVSIPYVILKRAGIYIGLLLDNPYATFMDTEVQGQGVGPMGSSRQADALALGAEEGQPNLILLYGPSLPALTGKLQRLVGVTPLPPLWSLGYQQCRWGYESAEDLAYLNAALDSFQIPCSGLWLDIEYMRGYRVFTFEEKKNFPDLETNLRVAQSTGRKVVPILDPGVKKEPGWEVYESGRKAGIYCCNRQGQPFVGLVWPGETVFPDFSLEEGRAWWADQVRTFASRGIQAAWLDMNDPSVGFVELEDMLFDHGRNPHSSFHNQYALGMARATRDGFLAARPESRPFLLSRSGFTGSSKYAAIWTGDNVSNYHYLKTCIPCTLNLALSGIPFNGPDVGGFAGHTHAALMRDWVKACFLFPFFRNHCTKGGEKQEPWVFDNQTVDVLRHFIRMRYSLLPYLYNLFVAQEETGAAILRPLFYDFDDGPDLPLDRIGDQFMVGPWIMQAPVVEEGSTARDVVLPDATWFSPLDGGWIEGNTRRSVPNQFHTTPIFFREGAILPMTPGVGRGPDTDLSSVRFHLFFTNRGTHHGETTYVFDDGDSFAYRKGVRSRLNVKVRQEKGRLEIVTDPVERGCGECRFDWVVYSSFDGITLNGRPVEQEPFETVLAGMRLRVTLAGKAHS